VLGKGREERPGDRAAVIGIAQQHLAAVGRMRLAAQVTGLDHPLNEVGDRGTGHAHAMSQLALCQQIAVVLRHHDV
jgi:hypothetical protein